MKIIIILKKKMNYIDQFPNPLSDSHKNFLVDYTQDTFFQLLLT